MRTYDIEREVYSIVPYIHLLYTRYTLCIGVTYSERVFLVERGGGCLHRNTCLHNCKGGKGKKQSRVRVWSALPIRAACMGPWEAAYKFVVPVPELLAGVLWVCAVLQLERSSFFAYFSVFKLIVACRWSVSIVSS